MELSDRAAGLIAGCLILCAYTVHQLTTPGNGILFASVMCAIGTCGGVVIRDIIKR